jgi:hypothetical protein
MHSTPKTSLVRCLTVLVSCLLTLGGCSLATSIQRDALDYNATAANYNDQVLLFTILRARDEAPINILTLSTINGALSIQTGVGGAATYNSPSLDLTADRTPGFATVEYRGSRYTVHSVADTSDQRTGPQHGSVVLAERVGQRSEGIQRHTEYAIHTDSSLTAHPS